MLKLTNVNKVYVNKKDKSKNVVALKNININFPRQGFVSILGPSGCGKTTLLNILGGLDTQYVGDLVVDGISTRRFKAKDWDAYRNNHVGFVFQEYNLIPHQNISKNVELVLSIAGASKIQTKQKSKKVLRDVGLDQRATDNPNKLSGGQKQRVAIARALVNDPELILADEPTSALDSKTSAQVMEILKEISKTKLVIMVTHNDELAKKYSSRIIRILDGQIQSDENLEENVEKEEFLKKLPENYKYGKSKMLFKTAAALSFNNLLTKKRRTILTILAGSIGIICLTVILGILRGSTNFAKDVYNTAFIRPVVIREVESDGNYSVVDSEKLEKELEDVADQEEEKAKSSTKIRNSDSLNEKARQVFEKSFKKPKKNKLTPDFWRYVLGLLDNMPGVIRGIKRDQFDVMPTFFCKRDGKYGLECGADFSELMYSNTLDSQFEFVGGKGHWPTKKDEVVIVLDRYNNLPQNLIDSLGIGKKQEFDVQEALGKEIGCFVEHNLLFEKNGGKFKRKQIGEINLNGSGVTKLKVVGVVKQKNEGESKAAKKRRFMFGENSLFDTPVIYSHELAEHIVKTIKNSEIVKAQKQSDTSVLEDGMSYEKHMLNQSPMGGNTIRNKEEFKQKLLSDLGYRESLSKISIFMKSPVDDEEKIMQYLKKFNEGKSQSFQIMLPEKGGYKRYAQDIKRMCIFIVLTIGLAALLSSLIMVALLEFISVLERVKEIGVLRSIGARKKDVSRLFKSEALIIGFFTGNFGVLVAYLFSIGLNQFIKSRYTNSINLIQIDVLVWLCMIGFSLIVTLLAGLIPAKIASRKDPVKILTGVNN